MGQVVPQSEAVAVERHRGEVKSTCNFEAVHNGDTLIKGWLSHNVSAYTPGN